MEFDSYLKYGDDTSKIDVTEDGKPIRNRWQWSWLSETSDDGFTFDTWCKKPAKSGICMCTVCGKRIIYGSSGKKSLRKHANLEDHKKAVISLKNSAKLPGASTTTTHTKSGIEDLQCENKAILSLFLAEHCLPFSLGPELLKLAQRLQNAALHSTSTSRQTVTYVTSHGVGEAVRNDLKGKLDGKFVSLNVDEATNSAGNKFLNVLVQYFDEVADRVKNQLLGTRDVNVATSDNILKAIGDIMARMNVTWEQIISITMDNCNVMRGSINGVEAQIRKDKNKYLLDVSGDTIHMINNAVKKFFIPIDKCFDVCSLACDVFYDIEDSPKVRSLFGYIQSKLYGSARCILRPMPTRFLQMNAVSGRFLQLWDAIWLYYTAFLSVEERKKYAGQVKDLLDCYNVPNEERNKIFDIMKMQREQLKSDANKDRKDRILNCLFLHKEKTLLFMNLYKGITEKFIDFTKRFQSNKPLMHELYGDMFRVVKEFFCGFVKSDLIPAFSVKQLLELDFADSANQLKDRQLGVGKYSHPILQTLLKDKRRNEVWLGEFFKALRQGYHAAAIGLKKLPLRNSALKNMSFLSPALQRDSNTASALTSLAKMLPNVVLESELGSLDEELRAYCVDDILSQLTVDEEDSDFRLDEDWWVHVLQRKKNGTLLYPVLGKLIKALLTVYTGPLVEGSFNIMGDIMEEDRTRLTTYNYESLAMIKSSLSANKTSAMEMHISERMKNEVFNSHSNFKKYEVAPKGLKEPALTMPKKNPSSSSNPVPSVPNPTPSIPNPVPSVPNPSPQCQTYPPQCQTHPPQCQTHPPQCQTHPSSMPNPAPSSMLSTNTCTSNTTDHTSHSTSISSSNEQMKTPQSMKRKHQGHIMDFFSKKPKTS